MAGWPRRHPSETRRRRRSMTPRPRTCQRIPPSSRRDCSSFLPNSSCQRTWIFKHRKYPTGLGSPRMSQRVKCLGRRGQPLDLEELAGEVCTRLFFQIVFSQEIPDPVASFRSRPSSEIRYHRDWKGEPCAAAEMRPYPGRVILHAIYNLYFQKRPATADSLHSYVDWHGRGGHVCSRLGRIGERLEQVDVETLRRSWGFAYRH